MRATDQERAPIRLRHDGGRVVVETKDEDRFVLAAQAAVEACKDAQRRDVAIQTFKEEFVRPVMEWCFQHADRVKGCYLAFPRPTLQMFIVTTSSQYDFAFGEEIADLTLRLTEGGWCVYAIQIPDSPLEELRTFFDLDEALEIHAQLPAAQEEGTA